MTMQPFCHPEPLILAWIAWVILAIMVMISPHQFAGIAALALFVVLIIATLFMAFANKPWCMG